MTMTIPEKGEIRWIEAEEAEAEAEADAGNNDDHHLDEDLNLDLLFAEPDPYETFTITFPTVATTTTTTRTTAGAGDGGGEDTITRDGDGDEMIRITLRGRRPEDGQTLSSTGLTLWTTASRRMCDFLLSDPSMVRGRTVVELGAGLGLCGMVAHRLGARLVVMTDGDTDALALMRSNVAANVVRGSVESSSSLQCRQLVWGRDGDVTSSRRQFTVGGRGFDVVLGSDVVYTEGALGPLFSTVAELLRDEEGVGDNDDNDHGCGVDDYHDDPPSSSLPTPSSTISSPLSSEEEGERRRRLPIPAFLLSYVRRNVGLDRVLECAASHGLRLRCHRGGKTTGDDGFESHNSEGEAGDGCGTAGGETTALADEVVDGVLMFSRW